MNDGARAMNEGFLPYCRPTIDDEEIEEVIATLRGGWLTTGPRCQRFETEFARRSESPHALALNSGTAALHLALAAAGISAGDEVVTTPLTFCACANVIVQQGAVPVLADISEDDLTIDPEQVARRITPRTRAILAVDYGGQPCRLDKLTALAEVHGLFLLEDAAHAAGARYRGRPLGAIAGATAFSFYPTKNITTGEGGMLTTASSELAERARMLALHGMSHDAWRRYEDGGSWAYDVVEPGFKYNLSDVQAALGLIQLQRLDALIGQRRRLAARYGENLASCEAFVLPRSRPEVENTWHLYPIRLRLERMRINRAEFSRRLSERGIGSSVHFIPLHHFSFYRDRFGFSSAELPVTERVYPELLSLPLYPLMDEAAVDRVCEAVIAIAAEHAR